MVWEWAKSRRQKGKEAVEQRNLRKKKGSKERTKNGRAGKFIEFLPVSLRHCARKFHAVNPHSFKTYR